MTQRGDSKRKTTQIHAAAVGERRRATVPGMAFGGPAESAPRRGPDDRSLTRAVRCTEHVTWRLGAAGNAT